LCEISSLVAASRSKCD